MSQNPELLITLCRKAIAGTQCNYHAAVVEDLRCALEIAENIQKAGAQLEAARRKREAADLAAAIPDLSDFQE